MSLCRIYTVVLQDPQRNRLFAATIQHLNYERDSIAMHMSFLSEISLKHVRNKDLTHIRYQMAQKLWPNGVNCAA